MPHIHHVARGAVLGGRDIPLPGHLSDGAAVGGLAVGILVLLHHGNHKIRYGGIDHICFMSIVAAGVVGAIGGVHTLPRCCP